MIPGLAELRGYRRAWLAGDLLAGVTTWTTTPTRTIPGLVVYRYDAPLFFANAEANIEVDFTALEAMDAVRVEITDRGALFALARVKQDLLARLQAFGLADKIGTELLFPTLPTAVQAFRDRGGPAEGQGSGNQRP